MKPDRDIERLLDRWFADGPMEVPDRVIDVVADRIGRQSQRPAWRLLWRDIHVNSTQRVVAVAAAIALVVAVGIWVVGRPNDSGIGAPPSPSPTPLAPPSPSGSPTPRLCQPTEPVCTGPLAPGTHSTSQIITAFTYTIPEGWSKPLDVPGAVNLELSSLPGLIGVWPDWAIASQASCANAPEPGVGRTVDDLITWLTEHPGLITSAPEAISIGGLDGKALEVRKNPDWTGNCPAIVKLFTHQGTINDGGSWIINDSARLRLIFLDAGDGHVVNIDIETNAETTFAGFVELATPIVESFDFSP